MTPVEDFGGHARLRKKTASNIRFGKVDVHHKKVRQFSQVGLDVIVNRVDSGLRYQQVLISFEMKYFSFKNFFYS